MGKNKKKTDSSAVPGHSHKVESSNNPGKCLGVWYRHSGQAEIDKLPIFHDAGYKERNEAQIAADVGDHHITHLIVRGDLPTSDVIGSHITHLQIEVSKDNTQLDRLRELKQLQVLHFDSCNFSSGFPMVVTQLTSLKELMLQNCELTPLPPELANLKQLQELILRDNDFSGGLPLVVTKMTSLNKLVLRGCKLRELPAEFSNLQELRELDLSFNEFTELPPPVYKLNKLQTLNISYNNQLTRFEREILQLKNLTKLDCTLCHSLTHPPKAVHSQGLHAVRKYFTDLEQSKEIKWSSVPVAVVGTSLSGKTSLIRSLQKRKRQLTFRDKTSPQDETTKVFKVEDLHFDKFAVKFVDYGGHEIYHVAYNIAKKDHCLPIAVVNMKEFKELADTEDCTDATKKLVFDWLSHLYVTNPRLGAPILVLTHTDELTPAIHKQCKEALLKEAEEIREGFLEEEKQLEIGSLQPFQSIDHFERTDLPLIDAADVFELDNDLQKTENINNLLANLKQRCVATSREIPEQWDNVAKFLQSEKAFHLTLSDVTKKFPMEGLDVVLRYLHNCGAILWFPEHSQLSGYVFHNVSAIVDMIALLFDHSADEQWKQSIKNYKVLSHNGESIGKKRYAEMVEEFIQSGMMAEVLLVNLLKKHKFPHKIALDLLQAFQILHGPMTNKRTPRFAIPSIAKSVMPAGWESDGRLQLRLDMLFKGLSPPKYVFHLITVDVLNFAANPCSVVETWRNGATVRYGECAIHLRHDYMPMKITLQVSTSVNKLGMSWKKLLETIAHVANMQQQTWPASRIETQVYCAHCLFVGEKTPSCVVHPDWLYSGGAINASNIQTFSGVELVSCKNSKGKANRRVPAVPCPLVFPCYQLNAEEVKELDSYLNKIETKAGSMETGETTTTETENSTNLQSSLSLSGGREVGLSVAVQESGDSNLQNSPAASPVHQLLTRSTVEDSDLSDDMDCLDETNEQLDIIGAHVELIRVTKPEIMNLFNSDTVYEMSSPTRGRCLIINNRQFQDPTSNRPGSETDAQNIRNVFTQLSFESPVVHNDLSGQDMLRVIEEETQHVAHNNYGMFVLVIMSHGDETQLAGTDGSRINLSQVYDLMSPRKFEAMAGKPKLLIIQACSGGRRDMMGTDAGAHIFADVRPTTPATVQPSTSATPPQHDPANPSVEQNLRLASDDLFIMRASFPSYVSMRHSRSGTWFVRALVEALYKHSCHRDIQTLFEKQVMRKVRNKSISYHRQHGGTGGQQPVMICTPTDGRKLYLFPGHSPASGQLS